MSQPVGIYVRVSRKGDREDERFHSPREQAERAEALARGKGFEVGPTFEDIDVSGATRPDDRPAMGELLAAIDRGELGGIAAFSLDRLSREPGHGDDLVKRVTKAGGVILTPDIPDAIDTPTGEFTFAMLLSVAKLYRSQAKARFGSATERATLAGIPIAQVPIGYRQRDDRRLEIDPDTAPHVRAVFEQRAAGKSWTDVSRYLTEATGHTWTRQSLQKIIKNRVYGTGRLHYGGTVSEHDAGAIVDAATWEAAQRAPNPPRAARDGAGGWLLTGLAKCSTCGHSMVPWKSATRRRHRKTGEWVELPKRYRRYLCDNREGCDARASISAEPLERLATLAAFDSSHQMATRASAPDLQALEEAVAVTQRRLDQVLAPEARDALGDLWAADAKARREEHEAALARLGEARLEANVPERVFKLEDVWADLSAADRRAALALFWKEVRVSPKSDGGEQHVSLIARGSGGETEVELSNGD